MIVIPMVGRSSRFFDAGYDVPKHQLSLNDQSVFSHTVNSFSSYFDKEEFLFLVRSDFDTPKFVERELKKLGLCRFEIQIFEEDTRGQAETVSLGIKNVSTEAPLFIFNIDTFRPNFRKSPFADQCGGYLEVFKGEGEHWSFVEPGDDCRVIRTTEKDRISNLCSDGLYHFAEKKLFDIAFDEALATGRTVNNEYYIAPLYNCLIEKGYDIRYELIEADEVMFCGTPTEYQHLLESMDEQT